MPKNFEKLVAKVDAMAGASLMVYAAGTQTQVTVRVSARKLLNRLAS